MNKEWVTFTAIVLLAMIVVYSLSFVGHDPVIVSDIVKNLIHAVFGTTIIASDGEQGA